jgi:hypothetical protein
MYDLSIINQSLHFSQGSTMYKLKKYIDIYSQDFCPFGCSCPP